MIKSFRDLVAYQKAYEMSLELHKLTLTFPAIERFELASQMRRSSKSVAMNIAEGFGKNSSLSEFKRFIGIAKGSLDEVRVCLDFCKDLGYISNNQYKTYEANCIELSKILSSILKNWR